MAVYDLAAQKTIKLTDDPGQWTVPFLPDSKRLIYVTPSDELVVVDIATGKRRVIPVTLGSTGRHRVVCGRPGRQDALFWRAAGRSERVEGDAAALVPAPGIAHVLHGTATNFIP